MYSLFNDEVIIKSQKLFRSDHHRVYTEEVNKIAISSNADKRIQTFGKVTTFPYETSVFKVCENEMLLKNKLIDPNEDIETEDIDVSKTEDIDISKNVYIGYTKTKDKDEDIDKGRNKLIQMFRYSKQWKGKKGNWKRRMIVWVFWDDDLISELCEKWICINGKYAYTGFEELRKLSGKVLFTREHKASTSKDESNTYIDIDELKMFKDFSTSENTTFKTKTKTEDKEKATCKTEDKHMLDKINKRIDTINKSNNLLAKLKNEITKKIELVYEVMSELQDEIYSDDSWLRLVELNKIDAIIDEALNAVWKKFYRKNRVNPEMIKIDKHKDIDGYVSKLTDIINNKIALLNRIYDAIDHAMSEIKNETNMIDEKIHKLSEMDNDTLHWINDRLMEFMNQSGRNLRRIAV